MRHVREHDSFIRLGRAAAAISVLALLLAAGWTGQAAAPVETYTFTMQGSDFLIPRPAETFPDLGARRTVDTHTVPTEHVGWNCRFVVTAGNGDSVHQLNHGYLTTNGGETRINDTETQPNITATRLDDDTLTLGNTVTLTNVIPGWTQGDTVREGFVATSVTYNVEATCTPPPQATTTTTSTSTTEPTTTTTPPDGSSSSTTTTTTPDTTTTTAPNTTTTTSVPATTTTTTTSSSTTAPPTTTTTQPTSTTSSPATTTTSSPTTSTTLITGTTSTTNPTGSTIPFTGPPVEPIPAAAAALALVIAGAAMAYAAREENNR